MAPTPPQSSAPASSVTPPWPGWWSRNWKWFVPTGCFTLLLLGAAFITLIVVTVFAAMKSTDAYKTATARAKANDKVRAALGTPIKERIFLSGKTNVEGSSGTTEMSIPISGPKGKGTIYVIGRKTAGRWSYSTLEVEVPNRPDRIDLNGDGAQ